MHPHNIARAATFVCSEPLIATPGSAPYSQNVTRLYVDKNGSCDGVNAITNGKLLSPAGGYYPTVMTPIRAGSPRLR